MNNCCTCVADLDKRVIVVDQQLYCNDCGYPLSSDDQRQNKDGRKIINGWVSFAGINRAGF